MIEAVLFDYGMVLSGPPAPAVWARMMEVSGLEEDRFRAAYWAPRHAYDRGTLTAGEYWLATAAHAGTALNQSQVDDLIEADGELWSELNQPMVDWAARLQTAGTRTGVLSNLGDAMEAAVIAKMPWLAQFSRQIYSHRLKLAKPELEIYQYATESLGTPASCILFIDDRADNCDGAAAAGMQIIQYVEHAVFLDELEQRGWGDVWRHGRFPSKSVALLRANA